MAYNSAFSPFGATVLVGTASAQVKASNNTNPTSYRFFNTTSSIQHISWLPQEPNGADVTVVVGNPASAPAINTLGLLPLSVEVFSSIPPNAWFVASADAAVEVTPGEGI